MREQKYKRSCMSSRFVTIPLQSRSTTCLANCQNKTILATFAKLEAGKTSTLSMLTGAILPSAGKAFLGGFDVVKEQWKATAFPYESEFCEVLNLFPECFAPTVSRIRRPFFFQILSSSWSFMRALLRSFLPDLLQHAVQQPSKNIARIMNLVVNGR